jgi:hypothetical protein
MTKPRKAKQQQRISGVKIACTYDELVPPGRLRPNRKNPYRHPNKQIRKLAEAIKHVGWRDAIVISRRSGLVNKGHARLLAAKLLGMNKVPVVYQDFSSDAEELAAMAGDNVVADLRQLQEPGLADIIAELEQQDLPAADMVGLDADEIDDLLADPGQDLDYQELELKPYRKTHVLLSFSPEVWGKVEPLIEKVQAMEGIEIEQTSN